MYTLTKAPSKNNSYNTIENSISLGGNLYFSNKENHAFSYDFIDYFNPFPLYPAFGCGCSNYNLFYDSKLLIAQDADHIIKYKRSEIF